MRSELASDQTFTGCDIWSHERRIWEQLVFHRMGEGEARNTPFLDTEVVAVSRGTVLGADSLKPRFSLRGELREVRAPSI